MPSLRLAVCLLVASALALADAACKDRAPDPAPPAAATKQPDNPLDQADVIFEGTVKSLEMAETEMKGSRRIIHGPPGLILVGPDPLWVLVVSVERVRKGVAAEWSGEKAFAIHSPARDLGLDRDKAPGARLEFYLFEPLEERTGPPRFSMLQAFPPSAAGAAE